jgi:hypothetical protein
MYLRDSQGRLRWFPPAAQGLDPFADPGGQSYAMQCAMMRQQMQQEEWMRFHAPPTGDQVHFQTKAPIEYVISRPPVSMGHRTSMRGDPSVRPFHNGNHSPVFGSGPSPRAQFELPGPSPRVAHQETRNPAPAPSLSRNDRSIPQQQKIDVPVAPSVSCMSTLFGAQVKQQHQNDSRTMLCYQADRPSTPELDIKLPSHYNLNRFVRDETNSPVVPTSETTRLSNPLQIFQCNGVRGPPKKFDYSFKPALPRCHGNLDVFYDALQEETPVADPPVEEDVLSVHDSFDEKTFLMDVDIVTPSTQRKKKGAWKDKIAGGKTCKEKNTTDQNSPEPIVEDKVVPQHKEALEATIEECRGPVNSRDSIEAARESPPTKNVVINLKVQRQPVLAVPEPARKVLDESDILSEDSKDAMYASVTNRKKSDPVKLFQQHSGHAAIISATDIIQKIASRDIVPSPMTILENGEINTTPEQEYMEQESAFIQERKPPRKQRSRHPKTRSKSKSTRGKSCMKVRDTKLSATDQAALAQSIREICLKATPELNGEDYPSFDEPKPKDMQGSKTQPGRDSPDSEAFDSSGGENKQQVGNEEKKKKRRSKKEKSRRSSSVKPSSTKKEVNDNNSVMNSGVYHFGPDDTFHERVQFFPAGGKAWQTLEQHV